jgi:hypothetical protein
MSETTGQDMALTTAAGCLYKAMNESGGIMAGFAIGHIPFGQVFIPFGYPKDEAGYWDIGRSGSGRLSLKAGATPDVDEYVRVFCQQVRAY